MSKLIGLCSVLLVSLILSSCNLFSPAVQSLAEHKINTSSGITQGQSFAEGAGVVTWYDIPYAQPPVGELRWRAPR